MRSRRVLVTGANGQLGTELVADLRRRDVEMIRGGGIEVLAAGRELLDVADRDGVHRVMIGFAPDVVIHAAAFTAVDLCESEPDRAFLVNALGTRNIAEAAQRIGAHLCYVSTDYVFDGTASTPYKEWDTPNPLSIYGRSKLAGELELDRSSTIARTSWVCGRHGSNMVKTIMRLFMAGEPMRFVDDQFGSPSIADELAGKIIDLALGQRPGIFHVTNQGSTSWFGFARAIVEFCGGDVDQVQPVTTAELVPPRPAPRPAYSVLDNAALRLAGETLLPHWSDATRRLVAELRS